MSAAVIPAGTAGVTATAPELWLAPLRGVTIRAFREAFATPIREAGFAGAFAPFIPANPGIRTTDHYFEEVQPFPRDRDASDPVGSRVPRDRALTTIPQVISKDPAALREFLKGVKARGFTRADLNAGCPFPMIRRRGRGSGLLRTPDVLERLIATGCDEMGPHAFSVKIRLGLEQPDELLRLMPMLNRYPLAVLTVHARTAKQMYDGVCDRAHFAEVAAASTNPVMYNGDVPFPLPVDAPAVWGSRLMIGRGFVRALGARADAVDLLNGYIEISRAELCGDRPVLGRMKELLGYWKELPQWRRHWPLVKICRSLDELQLALPRGR